jgi:hypothetical protein
MAEGLHGDNVRGLFYVMIRTEAATRKEFGLAAVPPGLRNDRFFGTAQRKGGRSLLRFSGWSPVCRRRR